MPRGCRTAAIPTKKHALGLKGVAGSSGVVPTCQECLATRYRVVIRYTNTYPVDQSESPSLPSLLAALIPPVTCNQRSSVCRFSERLGQPRMSHWLALARPLRRLVAGSPWGRGDGAGCQSWNQQCAGCRGRCGFLGWLHLVRDLRQWAPALGRLRLSGSGWRRYLDCLRVHSTNLYLRTVSRGSHRSVRWYACRAGQLVYPHQQSDSIVVLR